MLNNFIYAQTKDLFLEQLNAGNILDEAIVFIEDSKEIWNHGHYFGGSSGSEINPEIISELQTAIAALQSNKVDKNELADYALKSELPSLDGYLTKTVADGLYATIAQYNTLNQTVGNIQTELSSKLTSSDLADYAKTADVPTKISDLTDDSDFITNTEADAAYAPKSLVTTVSNQATTISTLATKDELSTGLAGKLDNSAASGFVPTTRKVNGKALDTDITITATDPNAATKTEFNNLSTEVAGLKAVGAQKNVQSDWNAADGDAFIKNKPNLSVYLTSDNASKTYTTIATANGLQENINNVNTDLQGFKTTVANTYITPGAVDTKIAALVGSVPETLNTLDELAAALGDDPNFATTVSNLIGTKASQDALNDTNTNVANLTAMLDTKLDKTGGTINGRVTIDNNNWASQLILNGTNTSAGIKFQKAGVGEGILYSNGGILKWYKSSSDDQTLLHSGNIGDYKAGSATKLEDNTAFTAWGQTFFENGKPKNIPVTNIAQMQYLRFTAIDGSSVAGYIGRGSNTINSIFVYGYDNEVSLRNSKGSLILNASGNVTIGDSDLAGTDAKLYVDGKARILDNVIIGGSSSENGRLKIVGENTLASTPALYISNSAGDGLLDVRNNGNVGIGISSPEYKLHVVGNTFISGFTIAAKFFTKENYGLWRGKSYSTSLADTDVVYNATKHVLAGGNVGIGVTNPSAQLHVKEDIVAEGTITANGGFIGNVTGNCSGSAGSVAWDNVSGKPTFATVATSGSYNDLSNKPTIPSVGNGTVTIKQNGTSKGTFTMNQSGNTTIELTDTNTHPDLSSYATQTWVNNKGYITGITKAMVTTALGYTPPTTNTTYSAATTSADGLMSKSDKSKLDGIASGATAVSSSTVSGWGFTKNTGTVTSVAMTVPTGLSVSGTPITTSGTLALSFASGYSIPTTAKQGNWDTAYGWGNHASAGYVKSSGVTSVATGTGLTGGTITSTGTISINTTYQGYITNGNNAWASHTKLAANKINAIPVTHKVVTCPISAAGSLAISGTMTAGQVIHVIVQNTTSSAIAVTIPNSGSYHSFSGSSLSVPASGYAEINVVYNGEKMFIRTAY